MSDNRSFPRSSNTNQDSVMDVDDDNQSQRKSSPMMRSRFEHMNGGSLNGGRDQSEQRNSGDVTITAGVGFHSPHLRRRGNPGFQGSSVTTVAHAGRESDETTSASVMRPQSGGSNDVRIRPNFQSQAVGCDNDTMGVVTIGGVGGDTEPNTTGQKNQQQEQLRQPHHEQQQQEKPVPIFGNCNPVRVPEVPVSTEPVQPQQQQRPVPAFGNCNPVRVPVVPITPEPPRPRHFQIHVKNFDGKTQTFTVERTTLVEALMNMIQQRLEIPPDQQVLQCRGKNLQIGHTLESYGIEEGSTIFLTGRLRGGWRV